MSLAKLSTTCRLTGTGMALVPQHAVDWVFGQVWDEMKPLFRFKSGPLAGYPDLLLPLVWRNGVQLTSCGREVPSF